MQGVCGAVPCGAGWGGGAVPCGTVPVWSSFSAVSSVHAGIDVWADLQCLFHLSSRTTSQGSSGSC